VIAGSPKSTRLETRCPGADVNPVPRDGGGDRGGLHGVEKDLKLTTPPITAPTRAREHSARAADADRDDADLRESTIARDWFGDDFVDHFAATREWEWRQWLDGVTDWELKRYFEII
jgi:glutamine synthetase